MSVVYYIPTDTDELLVSTMRDRGKARVIARDPKVSICVGEDARPVVAAMAEEEGRVVLRWRPYSTFAQPPRHLYRNDQEERITLHRRTRQDRRRTAAAAQRHRLAAPQHGVKGKWAPWPACRRRRAPPERPPRRQVPGKGAAAPAEQAARG